MNWTKMTDNFANYSGYQKSVILGEDILVYISNTTAYKSSGDVINKGRSWTQVSVTGLPENIKLSSLIAFGEKLYATNERESICFFRWGIMESCNRFE